MSAPPTRLYTHDDLLAMPDDGKRYEIIDGELHQLPSPTVSHQILLGKVLVAIMMAARQTGAGDTIGAPMDVILASDCVVQPDGLFIREERLIDIDGDGWVTFAPDILVEILSPASETRDRVQKFALYQRFGVPEYWLVDPEQEAVSVHRLVQGCYHAVAPNPDSSFTSVVLPELTIEPEKLFAAMSRFKSIS